MEEYNDKLVISDIAWSMVDKSGSYTAKLRSCVYKFLYKENVIWAKTRWTHGKNEIWNKSLKNDKKLVMSLIFLTFIIWI
jgi:hypothetical protein